MQLKLHMVTIEDLVPQEHFLRKLDAALDLSFVYEETRHMYSHRYGRPPIDPVMLVKYLLVGYLYGIPSERQIEQRIQTDVALRWYLGLDLFDRVPDHSTISQLRRRKPSFRKLFRQLFESVVLQCIEKGLVRGRLVGIDSTHVKANASRSSEYLVDIAEEPGVYWERLDVCEEAGLAELERKTGKRRQKRTKQIKKNNRRTKKRVSRTDPESGYMKRPGKPLGMHYLSHQAVDTDHGIILDVAVTSGDSSDAAPFLAQVEHIERLLHPQAVVADSGYDFALAHHVLNHSNTVLFTRPRKIPDNNSVVFDRSKFHYEEAQDKYICPEGKELWLRTLHRSDNGLYWVYRAKASDCESCPKRDVCLCQSHKKQGRRILRNYFDADMHRAETLRITPEYNDAMKKRQIWCEGTFAAQKRGHNLTRILRRGLEAAEDHCLLSATALNLKRMIRSMN